MAYKFNYKGLEISTDSAEDCLAVINHLTVEKKRTRRAPYVKPQISVPIHYIGQDAAANRRIEGETFVARDFFPTAVPSKGD